MINCELFSHVRSSSGFHHKQTENIYDRKTVHDGMGVFFQNCVRLNHKQRQLNPQAMISYKRQPSLYSRLLTDCKIIVLNFNVNVSQEEPA